MKADRYQHLLAHTTSWLPGTVAERGLFGVLLLLAAVLRFWGFPNIPFTHDELSAITRVDDPSLLSSIRHGVIDVDTHPPGVHVFLWAWTRLFGFHEGVVKLPFILLSLGALVLFYRFAYAWTSGATALIATAVLASLQYTVMYGQFARPYAAGLFTTAWLADQLTRYLAHRKRSALVQIAIAATLSAWIHHFAALSAAILYLTGWSWLERGTRKAYTIAGIVAVLAYLPNLPILLRQLAWGGLAGWLNPPDSAWLPAYAWWLAHSSWILAAAWMILLLGAGRQRLRLPGEARLWVITLAWGVLPLLIGFAYSVWYAPVLQYSVLLFSFPYVLVGALAGLRKLPFRLTAAAAIGYAMLATVTLVWSRRYYQVLYHSKYEALVRGTIEAEHEGRLAIVASPEHIIRFYRRQWHVADGAAPYVNVHDRPASYLDSVLAAHPGQPVFYAQFFSTDPENVARIQMHAPFLVQRSDMLEGQAFRFDTRPSVRRMEDHGFRSDLAPAAVSGEGWSGATRVPVVTDTSSHAYGHVRRWDLAGLDHAFRFSLPAARIAPGRNDVVELTADLEGLAMHSHPRVAIMLRSAEGTVFERTAGLETTYVRAGRARLVAALKLSDLPADRRGLAVEAEVRNPGGNAVRVISLRVAVREGDPVLYGMFAPIDGPWRYR